MSIITYTCPDQYWWKRLLVNSHSALLNICCLFSVCFVFPVSHPFCPRVYKNHLWLIRVQPCHMPLAVICIPFCLETWQSWLICVSDWMTYGGYLTTDTDLYVNRVPGLLQWILFLLCKWIWLSMVVYMLRILVKSCFVIDVQQTLKSVPLAWGHLTSVMVPIKR